MNQPAKALEEPMTNTETLTRAELATPPAESSRVGAAMSLVGLMTWLCAMVLAVLTPVLDLHISTDLILGMVIASGVISLLSLPTLLTRGSKAGDD